MLNDEQTQWLTSISEDGLRSLLARIRKDRLMTLDNAKADTKQGQDVQQEIAALHRLENTLISFRKEAMKSQDKQEK